jgi:hypothetical protein
VAIASCAGADLIVVKFNLKFSESTWRLVLCRIPASLACIGLLLGAIGAMSDKRKTLAIVGIIANLLAIFVLLTLDAAVGIQGG